MELRRTSIRPLFLAAAGLMAGSLLFAYVVGKVAVESSNRVASRRMIVQHLEQYVSSLKDAETGQRGYLLTGDQAYLQHYGSARALLLAEGDLLRGHADRGELRPESLDALFRLADRRLEEIERTLRVRRENGLDSALAVVRGGEGKQLMDQVRGAASELLSEERVQIEHSSRRAETAMTLRLAAFVGVILFDLAFIGWAYRRLAREIAAQEAALLESSRQKELIATTLSSIGDAVIVTDLGGRITFMNSEAERLTGWKVPEGSGRPLSEVFRIVNENTRKPVANPVETVLRRGTVVGMANHTILISKSCGETPIDDSASPIRLPDGTLYGVVLVFRDVAVQREAEEARARLAAIVTTSADAIVSKGLDGIIRTWNVGAERLFGYASAEVIGKSMVLLIPPDRLDEEREVLDRLKQGLSFERQQTMRVAKNGRRVPVSATSSPLRNPEGHVVGASTILRDITDVVAAQEALARARGELEHLVEVRTARLREVIDELQHVSYAITHDMRAPLRAMGMFAQLLLEDATERGLSPETIDFSRRIVTAATRLDDLIQDALSYKRAVLQELPMEPVPLLELLRGLLETYPNFHGDKADIHIDGELPIVLGNTSLLTQCFSNLLGNAVKFVGGGVKPKIRVWVQDNGIGIPKQAQSRLFGMFQKLDNRYEGTGVGLAIVRKVVERMGGSVGVDSDDGRGSRFWVDLPLPPKAG